MRRSHRLAAVVVVVALLSALASNAWAETKSSRPLTDRYCGKFTEYFVVTLIVEFVAGLAQAFGKLPGDDGSGDATSGDAIDDTTTTTEEQPDPDVLRSTIQVMLSPKFTALAGTLSHGGPKVMRREFKRERKIFSRGVALLRDAGLTEHQIEAIANAKIDTSTYDIEDVSDQIQLSDAETEALGRKFLPHSKQLAFEDLEREVGDAFEHAAEECGTVPSQSIDCEQVFSVDDAEAVVGVDVTLDNADGCRYVTDTGTGDDPEVAVVVYETDRAFENLSKPVSTQPVDGVGERAVSFEGYSASGRERTCGRTLLTVDHGRTIVTALCLGGDTTVDDEQLVEITQGVIDRLATG